MKIVDRIVSLISDVKAGGFSLLSNGQLSIKRLLALMFSLCLVYMLWYITHNIVPKENQDLFRHCFDVFAVLILLLTGAATLKDILALKNSNITSTTDIVTKETEHND